MKANELTVALAENKLYTFHQRVTEFHSDHLGRWYPIYKQGLAMVKRADLLTNGQELVSAHLEPVYSKTLVIGQTPGELRTTLFLHLYHESQTNGMGPFREWLRQFCSTALLQQSIVSAKNDYILCPQTKIQNYTIDIDRLELEYEGTI